MEYLRFRSAPRHCCPRYLVGAGAGWYKLHAYELRCLSNTLAKSSSCPVQLAVITLISNQLLLICPLPRKAVAFSGWLRYCISLQGAPRGAQSPGDPFNEALIPHQHTPLFSALDEPAQRKLKGLKEGFQPCHQKRHPHLQIFYKGMKRHQPCPCMVFSKNKEILNKAENTTGVTFSDLPI